MEIKKDFLLKLKLQQKSAIIDLLESSQHLVRITVDVEGYIHNPSPYFLTRFATQTSSAPSGKVRSLFRLSEFFELAEQELLTSMIFQGIIWKQIKFKELYICSQTSSNESLKKHELVKYRAVIIPWAILEEQELLSVEPERTIHFSKPIAELILIAQPMDDFLIEDQIENYKRINLAMISATSIHDLNNVLTGISTIASLMLEKIDHPDAQNYGKTLKNSTVRASELTSNLAKMIMNRQDADLKEDHSPINTLIESYNFFNHTIRKELQCSLDLTEEVKSAKLTLSMSPLEFTQILLNLLINAKDSIDHSGTIQIKGELKEEASAFLLQIEVIDTGCGIAAGEHKKLFSPFYTTKEDPNHQGLGLAIIKELVEKGGGTITFESRSGVGSTFKILLPVLKS